MTNAELIKALRYCGNSQKTGCKGCPLWDKPMDACFQILTAAADALEAAERLLDQNTKRCEALRKQLRESNESYEKHINELETENENLQGNLREKVIMLQRAKGGYVDAEN